MVVDVLAFIANIGMTVWKSERKTTTSMVLFFGLFMSALLYLPGMIPTDSQTMDSYWRWWVVHLWVEGVWELILGAILSDAPVIRGGYSMSYEAPGFSGFTSIFGSNPGATRSGSGSARRC